VHVVKGKPTECEPLSAKSDSDKNNILPMHALLYGMAWRILQWHSIFVLLHLIYENMPSCE